MRSTAIRNSALLLALVVSAGLAWGHPKGFHKKLTLTVTPTKLSALIVMDVDSGERCLLLREAVDSNRDGLLAGDEVTRLKERLVKLAMQPLQLGLSGAPIPLVVKEAKLSLREDRRANDSPLSIAVLVEVDHPHAIAEGMQLEVVDTAPDTSPIVVQVFQAGVKEPPFEQEVPSGVKTKIRMGALKE
jgi:hypothetical protein